MIPQMYFVSEGYRYGFNGMEQDNEVKGNGNHYTTYFRQYDSRLGRWFSVDPKTDLIHWESPFTSMGNNPIMNVDPNGDYFFGLIGSTKEQRQAATKFAIENKGTVVDRHKKSIHVSYTKQIGYTSKNGVVYNPLSLVTQQSFNKDGSLHYDEFTELEETVLEEWSKKENFAAKVSYNVCDDIFLFLQGSPFGALFVGPNDRRHLDGYMASQRETEDGFIGTASMLAPGPKAPGLFKKMSAAQFSKTFKGNLARLAPKTRGKINRTLNKAGEFGNAETGSAVVGTVKKVGEKLKEKSDD